MTLPDTYAMALDLQPTSACPEVLAIVAAYNEADHIAVTLAALAEAFPGVTVWVADDGSTDSTGTIAEAAGATVVCSRRRAPRRNDGVGKGGAVTLAAREALQSLATPAEGGHDTADGGERPRSDGPIVLLCDGDLGESAVRLGPVVQAVRAGEADLAVAAFSKRVGGGFGLAVGFAHRAIRRRCGLELQAPISGQRAMTVQTLARVLPFARGFGMEIGMTIDVARAGLRVREIDLDLSHRATGRTLGGFLHRARQLIDFVRVYIARR
jgi:glycosyltransferase involved in cell wall biosynthesis